MAKTVQVKPEEQFAREFADRLILAQLTELQSVMKLSEIADKLQKTGIGLSAVRSLLASNPDKFAYTERRWIPASRMLGAGRPLAEQMRLICERFGGPMPLPLLLSELGLLQPHISEEQIRRVVDHSNILAFAEDDSVFIRDWCYSVVDDPVAVGLKRERVSEADFQAMSEKLKGINWREPNAAKEALKVAAPINAKTLGAVAWSILSPEDPRAHHLYEWQKFYASVFAVEGYVLSADGVIHPESDATKWINLALKVADKLAPTVEIEDAAPIEVKKDDIEKMVKKILASETSVTASRLLEEFYEITPSVKTYPDDMANIMDALRARSEVQWVGGDRFNKQGVVPEFVLSTPEIFAFEQTPYLDEDGDPIDIELNDDGLSSTLRKLLNHPLAMDVMDEDVAATAKQLPETVRCVLKSIHRDIGTFPLCQIPTGWLENEPQYQEVILQDGEGREIQAWINTEARLIFGLIDWFYEQPVESGAVFSLTKTSRPNVFEFAWLDQTDPVVFITSQRMEELRELQGRADEMSTFDVLREVMSHWPKGADFLTLLWELNVVRRTSRRMAASLLSSYLCFYQRSGSPVWHYDSKKVEQGFDKTKKKFIIKH